MKTIQIILDVEVTDEELTAATVLHRWKKEESYATLLPGVVVRKAVALAIPEQGTGGVLADSLNTYPNVTTRLLTAARLANVFTIQDLAKVLPEFMKFRNVGDGVMKEAIRLCVEARAPLALEQLLPTHRSYAQHLVDTAAAAQPIK